MKSEIVWFCDDGTSWDECTSLYPHMFVQRHIYLLIRIELGTWIQDKMTQSWLQTKKKLDENLQEITSNLVLLTGNASAIRLNHKTSIPTFVGFISALLFNQDTIYIYSSVWYVSLVMFAMHATFIKSMLTN